MRISNRGDPLKGRMAPNLVGWAGWLGLGWRARCARKKNSGKRDRSDRTDFSLHGQSDQFGQFVVVASARTSFFFCISFLSSPSFPSFHSTSHHFNDCIASTHPTHTFPLSPSPHIPFRSLRHITPPQRWRLHHNLNRYYTFPPTS